MISGKEIVSCWKGYIALVTSDKQIPRQSRQGKYCWYLPGPVLEGPDLTEPFLQPVQTHN